MPATAAPSSAPTGFRRRAGRPSDATNPAVLRLLEQYRNLFSEPVWAQLPALLADLLARGVLKSSVIEELPGRRIASSAPPRLPGG